MPTYYKNICSYCKIEFSVIPRNKNQKYCNFKCARAAKSSKTEPKLTNCIRCSNPINYGQQKFCSRSCSAKFNNLIRSDESRSQQKATILKTLEEKFKDKPKKVKIVKIKVKKTKLMMAIDESLYPKKYFAIIKYTSLFLNKDKSLITYDDVAKFKDWLFEKINIDNLSPTEIGKIIRFEGISFSMFIKSSIKYLSSYYKYL
jgi:hypothetical protein